MENEKWADFPSRRDSALLRMKVILQDTQGHGNFGANPARALQMLAYFPPVPRDNEIDTSVGRMPTTLEKKDSGDFPSLRDSSLLRDKGCVADASGATGMFDFELG